MGMKSQVRSFCRGGGYRRTRKQGALESWLLHHQTRKTIPGVRSETRAGTGPRKCPCTWSRDEIEVDEAHKDGESHGFLAIHPVRTSPSCLTGMAPTPPAAQNQVALDERKDGGRRTGPARRRPVPEARTNERCIRSRSRLVAPVPATTMPADPSVQTLDWSCIDRSCMNGQLSWSHREPLELLNAGDASEQRCAHS